MKDIERKQFERSEWVVSFAGLDLAQLTDQELLDLRWQKTVITSQNPPGIPAARSTYLEPKKYLTMDERTGKWVPVRAGFDNLQRQVRAALEALYTEGEWVVPAQPSRWLLQRQPHTGQILKRYDADEDGVFFAVVSDLLVQFGARLRRCLNPACARFFLHHDPRQRYCSRECSNRVAQERFKPKRRRDFKAEYSRRVARAHPRARLKVGRKR